MTQIATLFANDINRQIEEVIKVDQTAEDIVAAEVDEYVVTDAIKRHFVEVFERYQETPQKPHEGIAIWVSGFFGSGKSSFAKVLGLTIENRTVLGEPVSDRFLKRTRRCEALRRPEDDQRANPDPHGHLRRLDRPRHPVRQPDAQPDHVPALPGEPRLLRRPRPLRTRNQPGAAGRA